MFRKINRGLVFLIETMDGPPDVVIGGGSGASVIGRGIADTSPHRPIDIITTSSDDGGSTGLLSDQYKVLPMGDPRRNLGALSPSILIAEALNTRFGPEDGMGDLSDKGKLEEVSTKFMDVVRPAVMESLDPSERRQREQELLRFVKLAKSIGKRCWGGLDGHAYGNLMLTGRALETNGAVAIRDLGAAIGARGNVHPVINRRHTLYMQDGEIPIVGEHKIDTHDVESKPDEVEMWLTDGVRMSPSAYIAARLAGRVILAPGSPYTSIIPALLAPGMQAALQDSKIIGVANLVNERHDTKDWSLGTYVQMYERYLGRQIVAMLYNTNIEGLPEDIREDAVPYDPDDERLSHVRVIEGDFVGEAAIPDKNSPLRRTRVNHSGTAVAETIGQEFPAAA